MRTKPGFSGSLPATGWSSSSPKWRAKATCSARVMSWSRKKSTLCFSSSARISAIRPGSREATPRFTLESSAPMAQDRGSTLIKYGSGTDGTTAGARTGLAVAVVIDSSPLGWVAACRQRPMETNLVTGGRRGPTLGAGGGGASGGRGVDQPEDAGPQHQLLARAGVQL